MTKRASKCLRKFQCKLTWKSFTIVEIIQHGSIPIEVKSSSYVVQIPSTKVRSNPPLIFAFAWLLPSNKEGFAMADQHHTVSVWTKRKPKNGQASCTSRSSFNVLQSLPLSGFVLYSTVRVTSRAQRLKPQSFISCFIHCTIKILYIVYTVQYRFYGTVYCTVKGVLGVHGTTVVPVLPVRGTVLLLYKPELYGTCMV